MDAEHTYDRVPTRLDEALRYAVWRIEKDPRNIDAIARYLGWYGHTRDAKRHPGEPIDLAGERAKQAANRAMERLRQDGFVPDVVEQSLSLIERSLPVLDLEACTALMKARLCFTRLSGEGLLAAAQCFWPKPPFEIARLGSSTALVKPGTTTDLTRLIARSRDLMQSCGCATTMELLHDAQEIFGPNASEDFTEAVIRSGGPFEWLDREMKWFWYIPQPGSNRVVEQIHRSLAAAGRIQMAMLRSAIRRDNGFGNFTPPIKIIEAICRRVLGLQIEGDSVIRVPAMAPRNDVLTSNERLLVNVLQERGPILEREKFLEHCRERGMDEGIFKKLTIPSLILQESGTGLYATAAAAFPAELEETGTTGDPLASTAQGLLSEGKLFLAWRLQPSMLQGGAVRVPEPINTFVQGDYNLKTLGRREMGLLHIRQRACWDVRRLVLALGGEAGDILVIILNHRDRSAAGLLGNDDVVAQVASGFAETFLADSSWSAGKESERSIA
jgi:hypothetical protein